MINSQEKIAIAPMLDWTDRHYRFFMRQLSQQTTLYTEMLVADAILHGDRAKLLEFNPQEQPLVVQLGGSDPQKLAAAAKICVDYGYQEINLNCGCPSDRVQSGAFGAVLMKEPNLVAACVTAIQSEVQVPVTIKHRIGLDYSEDYTSLHNFVATLRATGIRKFIVHARNAVLKGLSPKQNREIPPLKYDYAYRLKQDFPELTIMLNGGINDCQMIDEHLQYIDSVMLGRSAYHNPYLFSSIDQLYYNSHSPVASRKQVAKQMLPYLEEHLKRGGRIHHITRHMLGLYHGMPQARHWRGKLTSLSQNNDLNNYLALVESMHD